MSDEVEPGALRRAVLLCLAVVLSYVIVGAIAGVIWEWVWSPPQQIVQNHQLYYADYGSLRRVFDGTGLYAVVAAVASALMAALACLLVRRYELLMLAAVIVGSVAAAYTMHAVGVALGPGDPAELARTAADGTRVSGPLQVQGKTAYLVWPMVSLFVLSLVFFAWPGRARREPADAATASQAPGDDRGVDGSSLPADARQRLVARIESVRFTPVRVHQGYEMGAVDRLLDAAAGAVARGEPLEPVLDVPLPTVRLREGYDIAGVTSFLDQVRIEAEGLAALPETTPESSA